MRILYSEKDRLIEDVKTFDREIERIQFEKKETRKILQTLFPLFHLIDFNRFNKTVSDDPKPIPKPLM